MSTATKGLPNACPTCLVPAFVQCVTKRGAPTSTHTRRARGEWPVVNQCVFQPYSHEQVGAGCRFCGHTSLVHPQHFANPALTECLLCALSRTIREAKIA